MRKWTGKTWLGVDTDTGKKQPFARMSMACSRNMIAGCIIITGRAPAGNHVLLLAFVVPTTEKTKEEQAIKLDDAELVWMNLLSNINQTENKTRKRSAIS